MDSEPQKLLALEEQLRRDIEAISRVRQLMALNGSLFTPDERQLNLGISSKPPRPEIEDDEDAYSTAPLIRSIEQVINEAPTTRWTTQKVLARLNEIGYPLRAAKPIYSVGQSLNKLVKQGKIRLARKGSGSEPNIYKGKSIESPSANAEIQSQEGESSMESE